MNFRNLNASEIEVKVKKVTDKGVIVLLYKTARTDMDILDETVGQSNWINDYKEIKGNLYAGIGIKGANGEWIWKWDCGVESREDGDGNEKKGEASDAFKRAGFRWGIGRELYTSPFIFIPNTKCAIKDGKCYEKFSVASVGYSSDGKRMKNVSIVNDRTGEICFEWSDKPVAKQKDTQTFTAAKQSNTVIKCECCGNNIEQQMKRDGTMWAVEAMAAYSEKRYGKKMCAICMKKADKEEKDGKS